MLRVQEDDKGDSDDEDSKSDEKDKAQENGERKEKRKTETEASDVKERKRPPKTTEVEDTNADEVPPLEKPDPSELVRGAGPQTFITQPEDAEDTETKARGPGSATSASASAPSSVARPVSKVVALQDALATAQLDAQREETSSSRDMMDEID